MKSLRPVMLGGTGSDVGKSLIAAGLCRIFRQDGLSPAPFKAQNMALNSYATPDGREIGRAQAVQAEAAGIPCSTDMNPLLLKPSGEHTSQVVLNGVAIGNRDAYSYFRTEGRDVLRREVCQAFDRLSARFNPIVMEGAGSIAEINLRDTDLVNMSMARHADAAVILVADIDRGGVFASAFGSIMLQGPDDRGRIKGIIINKFRGDLRLFEKGRRMMEETCGVPVLGVVPFDPDLHIEEEDSVALAMKQSRPRQGMINIAVASLPHISNYTDFDTLSRQPSVNLYYASTPATLDEADIIILPGSKSTIADLKALRQNGMADAILDAHARGKRIIGICGGYQMMGREISDPDGSEGEPCRTEGLGLLPCSTVLTGMKVTRQVKFSFLNIPSECEGYEIHMGRTTLADAATPLCSMTDGDAADGCRGPGGCFGSYIHGLLDNMPVISYLLAPFGLEAKAVDYRKYKEAQYDRLAAHLRRHVDIPLLYKIMLQDD
ncbi:MAG: cobyric acid synthase [Pseudoflavonifractor sp.]|nr:cobyric acid synthase [Alloprevotella sp.]MCM1117096.1 cobyric acid synthase [Pseudoflavonifractor sp.]